ncbi:TPA: DNA methyltransferase [Escherichia coli]|uniref:DNA methyltransferase n=1 Tax=Enterobacteriaceae TaxID=543 RepID=UPI001CC18D1B|nr:MULTISPECIES: DNA methyltransferase [Enterobacteriaceae]MEC4190499.1 DNA methyltransferase [Escherichia coli]MEC4243202.1 DNA methyltransferase [Escherichia coli]DAU05297.1 MAG TPA: adenine-specific methyltransferase [Caudoviricetes sp.]
MTYQLHVGRCEDVLKTLPDNSVDAIVTDPPYGLSFMNHKWDYDVPTVEQWQECLRVLKPGGTVLDPWMGSGSTGRAAIEEGFNFIGIDLNPDYVTIASARIAHSFKKTTEAA